MTHSKDQQEKLVLFVYDELNESEREAMAAHLQQCKECQTQIAELRKLREEFPAVQADDALLQSSRRHLFYELRSRQHAEKRSWSPVLKPALQLGLTALLLFVGFQWGQRTNAPQQPPLENWMTAQEVVTFESGSISPHLLHVESIDVDRQSGEIQLSYVTLNDVRVSAKPSDAVTREMLRVALNTGDDPGIRLRAAKAVQFIAESEGALDASLIDALDLLLLEEENLGVRLAALKTLDAVSQEPQAQELLLRTLVQDDSEAARIQAFKTLAQYDLGSTLEAKFLQQTQVDSNVYIRTKALEKIENRKDVSL